MGGKPSRSPCIKRLSFFSEPSGGAQNSKPDEKQETDEDFRSWSEKNVEKDHTSFPIPNLPLDIFRVVASFLDFKTALRLHSITKGFTKDFWRLLFSLDLSVVWNYLTEERLLWIMDTKPISKLRSLNLAYCNRINWSSVEALGALPYLVSLDLTHWLQMTSLEWTALLKITQLRTLVLNGVPMIPLHDICGALTNLTHLEADHSSWDASSRLSDLTNLSMLSLGCTAPQKLPDIFHLFTNLKELSLRGFEFDPVEHIQFVSALSGMYKLHLMDCALTNNLVYPILSSLPLLVDVSLDGSKVSGNNETSAKTFSELEDEHRCPDTVLPAITDGLPYLHSLNLKTKHWLLDSIDMLSLTAPTAPELWRFSCRMTEDAIPVLSALVHLNYLDISSSPLCINDVIAGVTSLVSLRTLIMRNLHYDGEANLQPLSTLTNLTELNMLTDDYRSGIVDSSTIRHIPSLICLAVPSFNREADWTSHLRKHRKLKILWVSTMPRTNLEVLTKLTGLRTRHRWKYYNAREKEWKSNPHDLIDFPIH